jgi:biopolymer transport protein ExbB
MTRARRPAAAILAIFAVMIPALALAAGSWWNGDWKFRKEVGLDLSPTGADVAGTPQDLPVLLRLSVGNFGYFNDAKPDGSDFRLIGGDDKTPLPFRIERFDSQNQMAFVWVRVPQIAGGSKTDKVYLYYGNSDASAAGTGPATYDAGMALVLDFSEPGGLPTDRTAYKNDATASSAERVAASLIAGGAKFAGAQSITVPASTSLRLLPAQGLTASAWVKIDAPQNAAQALTLTDAGRELTLGIDGTRAFARYAGGASPVTVNQVEGEVAAGTWHHLALTAGNGKIALYLDGRPVGSAAVSLAEIGGTLTIGASGHASNFLTGELDEVEVSKAVRSADWIKASARGQGADAPLVVYGQDGQKEGGQGSYFGAIAKNLTVDGWVIIAVCFAMLILALIVMVLKAIYLQRVEGANRRFLADFRVLSGDAAALDHAGSGAEAGIGEVVEDDPKYGASTLYSLYHVGIAELNKRVAGRAVGAQRATVLSAQSIEAIRAAIDATATRLQQRLSARMVLLTIAISGGPFLGLLGTVIGVMITFAAIALSGDVNVNAIAPGTAAALAATVAGLAVAIPSLFGYNWLNTRIKAINADGRVFVDEFVTRVAEQYS